MIEMAAHEGLLGRVLPNGAKFRCSLYADDAGVFAKADKIDLKVLKRILVAYILSIILFGYVPSGGHISGLEPPPTWRDLLDR
jgi:hypothetical protein